MVGLLSLLKFLAAADGYIAVCQLSCEGPLLQYALPVSCMPASP